MAGREKAGSGARRAKTASFSRVKCSNVLKGQTWGADSFIHLPRSDVLGRQQRLSNPASEDATARGRLGAVEERKQRPRLAPVGTLQHLTTHRGASWQRVDEGKREEVGRGSVNKTVFLYTARGFGAVNRSRAVPTVELSWFKLVRLKTGKQGRYVSRNPLLPYRSNPTHPLLKRYRGVNTRPRSRHSSRHTSRSRRVTASRVMYCDWEKLTRSGDARERSSPNRCTKTGAATITSQHAKRNGLNNCVSALQLFSCVQTADETCWYNVTKRSELNEVERGRNP